MLKINILEHNYSCYLYNLDSWLNNYIEYLQRSVRSNLDSRALFLYTPTGPPQSKTMS